MSSRHPMDSHDPRRPGALALVRRTIAGGKYKKTDVAKWVDELGDVVLELVPKSKQPKSTTEADTDTDTDSKE